MGDVAPIFFHLTAEDLWRYVHPLVYPAWILLIVLPRWKYTMQLALIPSLLHALLYTIVMVPLMLSSNEQIDLNSLHSVKKIFQDTNLFFCGWIHYLSFDLLVGRGIAVDAISRDGVTLKTYYLLVAPCIFATFMLGPVGFFAYSVIQLFAFPEPWKQKAS